MKLNNTDLYQLFREKNIDYLYHANTVATSITFIREGGLLSRGGVEARGLYQTPQESDNKDRLVGVWNDVFLDTVDLHGFFPWQNLYGPVLFKFSIDLILNLNYEIWITKNNPKYWNDLLSNEEKYFVSVEELKSTWDNYPTQRKMFTIRNNSLPILFEFLVESKLDDPMLQFDGKLTSYEAINGLRIALNDRENLRGKFKIRDLHSCYCYRYYLQKSIPDLKRLFYPAS